jgi:hypothetical protein
MNENLLTDRSFGLINLPQATLLGVERAGSALSQKLSEKLCLLLRAGNCAEAITIWNTAPAEALDLATRQMLLTGLLASAANDLSSSTTWRGLSLTKQIQLMLTPDAMTDPAVSLGMLQLDTLLAIAGSGEVALVRDSFDARLASIAPRVWFETLGRKMLAAANEPHATVEQRQAAVDKLRRLTTQLPDSAELQQQLTEALQ